MGAWPVCFCMCVWYICAVLVELSSCLGWCLLFCNLEWLLAGVFLCVCVSVYVYVLLHLYVDAYICMCVFMGVYNGRLLVFDRARLPMCLPFHSYWRLLRPICVSSICTVSTCGLYYICAEWTFESSSQIN